ncbi:MAG: 3-phosphoserine/phosphohydroxythreonine transaminase [Legionellaceae bacterium]|nr:3-phosphoserine/phosphohydroxythreonine transaminase [Legionellaceae bacterium]
MYYFGAGPAIWPESVKVALSEQVISIPGVGLSLLEIGHRSAWFKSMMEELNALAREVLEIPLTHAIFWMPVATRVHFGLIPLHFLSQAQQAEYYVSGIWSDFAYQEACAVGRTVLWTPEELTLAAIGQANTVYRYCTPNETIEGIRLLKIPARKNIPWIADMTSCIGTEAYAWKDYGFVVAGCQKNLGCAGFTLCIVEKDFLKDISPGYIPKALDYRVMLEHESLYATPPAFACYAALSMLQWLQAQGGVHVMSQLNIEKSERLYAYIDGSSFYENKIPKASRSRVNIPFQLSNPDLQNDFLAGAKQEGLLGLEGHARIGGLRASMYNAMPMAGVNALLAYMQHFEEQHDGRA